MTYVSPCCAKPTLPPAVMPNNQRHCPKCGNYYAPTSAVKA